MDTQSNLPKEQKSEKKQGLLGVADFLFDFLETFAVAVFVVLILFTFFFRLCEVDGQSMENTLYGGQKLILSSAGYTPEQGDIVVFHLTDEAFEKSLVKRVIATEGQEVKIDFTEKKIYVDGLLYDDPHAVLKSPYSNELLGKYTLFAQHHYDAATNTFQATVPEGCIFVLGDNRNNSKDSRFTDVGFVDSRCVLGKAILRLSPFTILNK